VSSYYLGKLLRLANIALLSIDTLIDVFIVLFVKMKFYQ